MSICLYKAGRRPTRRETARWISLRASEDAAPYTPSPSALRAATSPEGRGKNAPMQVVEGLRLAPPLGELSPQVTERENDGNNMAQSPESTNVGDGLPDVPQHKRKCRLYKAGRWRASPPT